MAGMGRFVLSGPDFFWVGDHAELGAHLCGLTAPPLAIPDGTRLRLGPILVETIPRKQPLALVSKTASHCVNRIGRQQGG